MSSFKQTPSSSILGSPAKDIVLPSDAEDTISSVSWSPVADHLAVASWDGRVRVYDVAAGGSSARGVAMLNAEGPVFDCDWAKDGSTVLAGGADRKITLLHLATGQQLVVGAHDAPVRGVRFVDVPGCSSTNGSPGIVASGSWDRTVKFWDPRQSSSLTAVATLACRERVYAMDSKAQLLVVATADRHVHLVDLRNPTVFLKTVESPLKHQTRTVAAFPDGKGFGIASIEGRCGINAVDQADTSKVNFTFRCHRGQADRRNVTKIWSVNSVQFHPVHPTTFTTAGSDGSFHFWDRVAHTRLKGYNNDNNNNQTISTSSSSPSSVSSSSSIHAAVTATAFNRDGSLFAYATGYDWSMGHAANSPQIQTRLLLHPVLEEDVAPKGGRRR